jgi:coproporphyrinogen III oxidase
LENQLLSQPNKVIITEWFKGLQDHICEALTIADGVATLEEELWEREGGGGGRTRIMQNGAVIEKGGVNFSAVHGQLPDNIVKALGVNDNHFYATGVSIVMHPNSPMVPIIHMNVRYFELNDGTHWFGGGIDLTPHYVVPEDAAFFHQYLKTQCDQHNAEYYPKFKNWADDYFYIKHRNETRGVGGIFFDRLVDTPEISFAERFEFVKAIGNSFAPIYTHLINKNKGLPYSENEKQWQYQRRSRYVEFNLVYDKGTKFGLDTDGRSESILMSLPPQARWIYNFKAEPGSAEEFTLNNLKKGINWIK